MTDTWKDLDEYINSLEEQLSNLYENNKKLLATIEEYKNITEGLAINLDRVDAERREAADYNQQLEAKLRAAGAYSLKLVSREDTAVETLNAIYQLLGVSR